MSAELQTYDLSLLERSRAKWQSSPALRTVYADIFRTMQQALVPGRVLEIGSGIAVTRDYFRGLVTSDVEATSYVDRAVSAYAIPPEGWGNVIAMDVLHHLREPLRFFESAAAGLKAGGRLILAEPAANPCSRLFYRLFHHEPCRPGDVQPPFQFPADPAGGFANMGMAQALFGRPRPAVTAALQTCGMRLVAVTYRDFLAYPATGGFSRAALLPAPVLRAILAVEGALPQWLMRFMALRMIVVLEKNMSA